MNLFNFMFYENWLYVFYVLSTRDPSDVNVKITILKLTFPFNF